MTRKLVVCLLVGMLWGLDTISGDRGYSVDPTPTPSAVNTPIRVQAGADARWTRLADGRELQSQYSGDRSSIEFILDRSLEARALASADFDEDGVPDLVVSLGGAVGGALVVYRGNIDSIYPNSPAARARKAEGGFTDLPFLSPAVVYPTSESADFVAAGDFDGDGHFDIACARRGGGTIELHLGDGQGGLIHSRSVILPGSVTQMVAGDVNRRDGLDDLLVAIDDSQGARLLVFEGPEGALNSEPEPIAVESRISAIALGWLDDHYAVDIAVASGNELVIVGGRDRRLSSPGEERSRVMPPRVDRVDFGSTIASIAVGSFLSSEERGVAVLDADGTIRVASFVGRKRRVVEGWTERWKVSPLPAQASVAGISESGVLVRTRTSGRPTDDLLLLGMGDRQLRLLGDTSMAGGKEVLYANSTPMSADEEVVAVLPMRLNSDALSDLVVLRAGSAVPSVVETKPAAIFTVTTTDPFGEGSLFAAIVDANVSPGPDLITFAIPGEPPFIINKVEGYGVGDVVTIDATTQPGFDGEPVVILNGLQLAGNGLGVFSGSSVIRGLFLTRFNTGISLQQFGGNIVEGNVVGRDGRFEQMFDELKNRTQGVSTNTTGDLIGGTAGPASNIIASNVTRGVFASNGGSVIQGNYIGNDGKGNSLGFPVLQATGVMNVSTSNLTIGGTVPGAGNVIAGGNSGAQVWILISVGTLVQGNHIGVFPEGAVPGGAGMQTGAEATTIGGTSPAASNVISGVRASGSPGAAVLVGGTQCLVQGNYIGVDKSGSPIPTLAWGVQSFFGSDNLIGGVNPGSGNSIAFNARGGIAVLSGTGIRIVGNSLYENGGPGIDLNNDGQTLNDELDADTGPNNLQNYPILTSAIGGTLSRVRGSINTTANSAISLDFYTNDACDPSGFGEGKSYVGSATVFTDAAGNATFDAVLDSFVQPGQIITSTATGPDGSTSEFSSCVVASLASADLSIAKVGTPNPVGPGGSLQYSISVANAGPDPALDVNITDLIPALTGFLSIQAPAGWNTMAPSVGSRGLINCTKSTLGVGETDVLTLVVRVDSEAVEGTTISNTAEVSSSISDPQLFNNSATSAVAVSSTPLEADLRIRNESLTAAVATGERVAYKVEVENHGPDPALGVVVSGSTPQGTTLASLMSDASQADLSGIGIGTRGSFTIALGTMSAGSKVLLELRFNVTAPSGTMLMNTVEVHGASNDPDDSTNASTATVTVRGGGIGLLSWEQPASTAEVPNPAPMNAVMRAGPASSSPTGFGTQSSDCILAGFNVYISTDAQASPSLADLWLVLPATAVNADVPVPPTGASYLITSVWNCAGVRTESVPSNVVDIPAGPSFTRIVLKPNKLKFVGVGFQAGVSVHIDGIGFVKPTKIKKQSTVAVQKGTLVDGRSLGQAVGGRDVVITVRNADGGLASFLFHAP